MKTTLVASTAIVLASLISPLYADSSSAPEGFLIIETEIIELFVGEPESSFIDAVESFEDGDMDAVSRDIRRAAAVLRIEGKTLNNEGSDVRIREAATRLESLARRVENDEIDSLSQLDAAFAHAHYVLGTAYTMEGEKYWEQNAQEATMSAIKAAQLRLSNAAKWSNTKLSDTGSAAFAAISSAGKKAETVGENATAWLKSLQTEANTIGEAVEDK